MKYATATERQTFFAQHHIRDVELRICQVIPIQAVTGDYSYNPVFPDADPAQPLQAPPAIAR